jgi:hypothetical protein
MRLAPLAARDTANFGMNNWFSLNQSFVFFGPDGLSEHEVQLQIFRENPLKPVGCSIAPRTPTTALVDI